jgi:pimeloyl-ACP methyl ester carboxylesterase
MKKSVVLLTVGIFLVVHVMFGSEKMKTEKFAFKFEGKKLSGILDLPIDQKPTLIVIIVPGDGKTDIVEGKWFYDIRTIFVEHGIGCCVWDKAGCGKSEGQYFQQTVQNSANEVICAMNELKKRNIQGSENIGLWGISRAGWICPLVIQEYPSVAFWIPVSGTDDKENFAYLMESNLRIAGKSEAQVKLLVGEWYQGSKIFRCGGSMEEYLKATQDLQTYSFCIENFGYDHKPTSEEYVKNQNRFINEHHLFDEKIGLMIYIPNFHETLNKIECPVLAIFGEKDTRVDWRKTIALYRETIGNNKNANLTIKTFQNCNHNIQKCKTGRLREHLDG